MGKDDWMRAAHGLPFLLPRKAPATRGEQAALHLPIYLPRSPRDEPGRSAGNDA
jgi:hypothetical protein